MCCLEFPSIYGKIVTHDELPFFILILLAYILYWGNIMSNVIGHITKLKQNKAYYMGPDCRTLPRPPTPHTS